MTKTRGIWVWERGHGDVLWAAWPQVKALKTFFPGHGDTRHGSSITAYRRPDGECIAIEVSPGSNVSKRGSHHNRSSFWRCEAPPMSMCRTPATHPKDVRPTQPTCGDTNVSWYAGVHSP